MGALQVHERRAAGGRAWGVAVGGGVFGLADGVVGEVGGRSGGRQSGDLGSRLQGVRKRAGPQWCVGELQEGAGGGPAPGWAGAAGARKRVVGGVGGERAFRGKAAQVGG